MLAVVLLKKAGNITLSREDVALIEPTKNAGVILSENTIPEGASLAGYR